MEAPGSLTAEEERRQKLLEYLAAKGKLKPQNNSKPYLRDCTNLQNRRPQETSKKICEKKKNVPHNGTRFGFEANKNRASNAGPFQYRSTAGKIPTQQAVSANRFGDKTLYRNPVPPKLRLPRVRPDQQDPAVQSRNEDIKDNVSGSTLSSAVPESCVNEAERDEGTDVKLTVTLTKSQQEGKAVFSKVCVADKASLSNKRLAESGGVPRIQTKKRQQRISQSSRTQVPSIKPPHESKTKPSAARPMASTGYISVVNQPTSKTGSTTERRFLMKSSRTDGLHPNQPPSVHVKASTRKPNCTTKPKSTASSTVATHKTSSDPVSIPKNRQHSLGYASEKAADGQSRHFVSKPSTRLKSTGPTACHKTAIKIQAMNHKQTNGRESTQAVTNSPKETTKPSNLAASDTNSRPHTPKMTAEVRKKKLQEWLSSKGKTYKRPPMTLPPKRPPMTEKRETFNRSLWEGIEEEEELLFLSNKISRTLTECLELVKKGVSGEAIHTVLDKLPKAKRFAKYWVCKARLLEREGIFDVVELYKQGVQCGATPIDELRDVVFDIMKNTSKKTKVVTFGPLPGEDVLVENKLSEDDLVENEQCADTYVQCLGSPTTLVIKPMGNMRTPGTRASTCDQGSAVKLQVACLSSKKMDRSGQEWKRLTPVRRPLRIQHSVSHYPEVVQEHDTVVSSLEELLDMADTDTYLYMSNEALPEGTDHNILGIVKQDPSEDDE